MAECGADLNSRYRQKMVGGPRPRTGALFSLPLSCSSAAQGAFRGRSCAGVHVQVIIGRKIATSWEVRDSLLSGEMTPAQLVRREPGGLALLPDSDDAAGSGSPAAGRFAAPPERAEEAPGR